ncbi:MAG: hypothetical protein A2043_09575 [Candidatus Schekmanbacteria bacterium GWA2_38_9]|uniref:Uncharacterized protein n=1 Tax=Candidatus Schekmanbacteria bacterium RIFCSPLOWO2_12_FULL_38_15 TaxID=1817883 RepID=A0A1F7SJH0_9BACT|nr:MAG: hypothetical protein A2043_09575 [Candidatus Schekmanbacteria bacterium GWA2_38_9]OGL50452.1 MAG: hypothetical protein A3H37_06215 [Candidatus Schekmanbacteria bacterium RIFCSPLOWO2_02_FULL_38_14]OGL53911.1 MAG: hypothetical protein A3G31_00730 [Candidatus Schekmanbacteria bacterium RIFCSPLOWO2_12_FULL_38_15]
MFFLIFSLYMSIASLFGILFRSYLIFLAALIILSNFFKRFLFIGGDPGILYNTLLLIPDFFLLFYIICKSKHLFFINKKIFFFLFSLFVSGVIFLSNVLVSIAYIKIFVIYIFFYFFGKETVLKNNYDYDFFKDKFSNFIFLVVIIGTVYIFLQRVNNYFSFEKAWLSSGYATIGGNYFADMGVYRYISIFSGLREAAIYFIIGIFFVYYYNGTFLKVPIKWIIYVCLIGALILVGSRGSLVGLMIAIIVIKYIINKKRLMVLTGVILCIFFLIYFNPVLLNELDEFMMGGVKSSYLRRMLFSASLGARVMFWGEMIPEHLFQGDGLGAYTSAASLGGLNPGSESQIISFLLQGGMLLMIAYLTIVYGIFKIHFLNKSIEKSNGKKNVSLNIVILILMLIIFDSLFNPTLDSRATSVVFWYYLGVLYTYFTYFAKYRKNLYSKTFVKRSTNENTVCA